MRITSPNSGDHWQSGNPYAVCDECGLVYRKNELRRRWDGALVCDDDWEIRHPQESVVGIADKIAVVEPRPETFTYQSDFDACYGSSMVLTDTGGEYILDTGGMFITETSTLPTDESWTSNGWVYDPDTMKFGHVLGTDALFIDVGGLTVGGVYDISFVGEDYPIEGLAYITTNPSGGAGDTTISMGQSDWTFTATATTKTFIFTPTANFNGTIKLSSISISKDTVRL